MGTARLDRTLLLLLGLLLTASGVVALLAGTDLLGGGTADEGLLDNVVAREYGRDRAWLWPVTAVIGLLLGLLALRWLVAQLTPTRVSDLELEPSALDGRTGLSSSAVGDAVVGELQGYRGVRSARAVLRGTDTDPRLQLTVRVARRTDVVALRQRIEQEAVAHAREALDDPALPVRLDLEITDAEPTW